MLCNVSESPLPLSPAVTFWPSAVTEPLVAAGVPPRPPALPIATMRSPTCTDESWAVSTVFRPETPSIFSSATSSTTSKPSTCAVYVSPVSTGWTLIAVAPSITWLLVSTSPSDVMIMPVPAASPWLLPVSMVVKMSTTAGFTFEVMAAGALLLPDELFPLPFAFPFPNGKPLPLPNGLKPLPPLLVFGGAVAELLFECTAELIAAPTPPDAIARATIEMATRNMRATRLGRCGSGGGPQPGAP